jgi:3-oxoacyl-[acyl-carrier-protein] synthase-3
VLGIRDIEIYIPPQRVSNYDKKDEFQLSNEFIENKLGVKSVSRIEKSQSASDLCCIAYERLIARKTNLNPDDIDVIIVCTQNPDYSLPHTSAVVHGRLNLSDKCAAFDVSLGCSGYVYTLAIIESLMKTSDMKNGLLFTADPYSKIIDENDKNTVLLFGDAATVTYLSQDPVFISGKFTYGTKGKGYEHLICRDEVLKMNGREIFNFAARTVPDDIKKVLRINNLNLDDIDRFLLHQGSKYMIDFLIKRTGLPEEKTPYVIQEYGNTVSSSIPIMLKDLILDKNIKRVLINGFGVGLSWASTILTRTLTGG